MEVGRLPRPLILQTIGARVGVPGQQKAEWMIPLADVNPTRRVPIMNLTLIGINVLVFLYELSLPDQALNRFMFNWGLVPHDLLFALGHPFAAQSLHAFETLITSQFIHAGWAHIIGNMLFLWIFGDNIEDVMGSFIYLIFYLVCGVAAGLAQTIVLEPFLGAGGIPSIGASGAIAGVLGAYLILYPGTRVRVWVPVFLILVTELPALIMIGIWFAEQFIAGLGSLNATTAQSGGIAFWAHVGGFVTGIVLILPFWGKARQLKRASVPQRYPMPYDDVNRW